MSDWLLSAQRYLIAATVFLTCSLFSPALADPVNVVKLTVLTLAAVTVLVLSGLRLLRDRVVPLPRIPAAYAAVALLSAFVVSALAAPMATTAIIGTYGRNSGLLAYTAALVLFAVGIRAWRTEAAHVLALALLAAGLFTASYGALQYLGIDAIAWNNPFSPIIASLGNPDFSSAYLGLSVPVAAWGALWTRWGLPLRIVSGATGLACLTTAVLSKAVQGPIAALAGLAVLVVALLLERGGRSRKIGLPALATAATVALLLLAAGAVKVGPAAPIFRRVSFQARQWYWDAALTMFRQHPIVGVGLDHYGAYWRQARPEAASIKLGGNSFSDAAHSVPLQMMAQGGLVLGLAYLAFVILVCVALVRGLRRLEGQQRLLIGGLGGAWIGYLISSCVSIDQVPLLTVNFVVASAVVAMGYADRAPRELRLPGALTPDTSPKRRGRGAAVVRHRSLTGPDVAVAGLLGVIALVLAWFSLLPLRANAAAHKGDFALATGDGTTALEAYESATNLLPGTGVYWIKRGNLLQTAKRPDLALSAFRAGVRHDPFDPGLLLGAGALASQQGQPKEAENYFLRAVRLDPTNPVTLTAAAAFLTEHGRAADTLTALARPLALFPDNADLWTAAGKASAAAHDTRRARVDFERALKLQPDHAEAKAGLAALGPQA